jgi:hypothetical protein
MFVSLPAYDIVHFGLVVRIVFPGVSVTSSPVTGQRGVRLPGGETFFGHPSVYFADFRTRVYSSVYVCPKEADSFCCGGVSY